MSEDSAIAKLLQKTKKLADWVLGDDTLNQTGAHAKSFYKAAGGGIKNVGGGTLDKAVARFNEAVPYIERAGYHVTDVELKLGIPPNIIPYLEHKFDLSEDEKKALLDEVKDKTLIKTLLNTLFRANEMAPKVKFDEFEFSKMELEVGLLPSISLKYNRITRKKGRATKPKD